MYLFQLRWGRRNNRYRFNLHSTMYLFQPPWNNINMILVSKFTFHYVSISTSVNPKIRTYEWLFTFHYVSISTLIVQVLFVLIVCIYIPLCIYFNVSDYVYFTLNPDIYIPLCIYFNSGAEVCNTVSSLNLHSTMYLFQLLCRSNQCWQLFKFTFHYVSIST